MATVITLLVALIGILVTVLITVTAPRMLGQIVPVSQVDAMRAERDKAQAEALAWKTAHEGVQRSNDLLLTQGREKDSLLALTNAIMTGFKQLPAQSPPTNVGGN